MSHKLYLNLNRKAPFRLAVLRKADPSNWRRARACGYDNVASYCSTLSGGCNDGRPVWYSFVNPNFRAECYASDLEDMPRCLQHQGWYTDTDFHEVMRGVVARLPHGRFIAGYEWSTNGERVWFPEVFTSAREAAYRADAHAEHTAEREREYQERYDAWQRLEIDCDDMQHDLRKALTLRNHPKFPQERARAHELIDKIRETRAELEPMQKEFS